MRPKEGLIKKHSASTPRPPNLGGEKVFFVISKIAHIASNFLYNKVTKHGEEGFSVFFHFF